MKKEGRIFNIFVNVFLSIISIVCISIFVLVLVISISNEGDILNDGFSIIPKHIDFSAYKMIFSDANIIVQRILWSMFVALVAPLPDMIVSILFAYALSQEKFKYKKIFHTILLVSSFVNAGMIAGYIVRAKVYGLVNNPLIYFLPGIGFWGVMLYKTIFQGVPKELIESARIDGASELKVLWNVIVPLSKALVAINYFNGVLGNWNGYMTSLIYMGGKEEYQTLMHYMQRMMSDMSLVKQSMVAAGYSAAEFPETTMKYAVCFISLIPVFILFPFVQKHFSKGIAVGSVKG